MGLRVLHVNNLNAPLGGTETYLHALLAGLTEAGIEVGLVHGIRSEQDWRGDPWPTFFVPEMEPRSLPSPARRFRALEMAVERFRPDVIQLHNILDPAVLDACCDLRPTVQLAHVQAVFSCPGGAKYLKTDRVACHRRVAPFCIVAPAFQSCGPKRPLAQLAAYARVVGYQRGASRLARIVVASDYMREELLLNGIAVEKILVAPLPSQFRAPSIATEPSEPEPMVLFVGRLIQDKGPDMLVEAARAMSARCHLVFVGDGPQRADLEATSRSLRDRHRVTFAGWASHDDAAAWYARSSIVAVPSLWPEPYGLVGVEAMTFGRPVVAFDVGGVRAWLRDGVNGFLLPAKDVGGLARALDRLLSDRALARRLGEAGRALAAGELSLERHLSTMTDLYRDVAGSHR